MSKIELIATATFGLEAVVKREIEKLGYKITQSENSKITYMTDERGIARSNLWLRSADRVLLKMGEFPAETSEDLFQQTKALPWEEWIPEDGKFTVQCTTVKSKLRSEPANQKTVKKAIVERMQECYLRDRFPETGAEYTVKVTLLKDRATLTIDTSGSGLHTRGYRKHPVTAPIKETLAAALVQLSFWRSGRLLIDPFCGSGTIPIEAAMIERNIAPGLGRTFASERWDRIDGSIWKEERTKAYSDIDYDKPVSIIGCDIDGGAVEAARANAEDAGVDDCIVFKRADFLNLEKMPEPYSVIITNPPYGERIGGRRMLENINGHFARLINSDETLSCYVITEDKGLEKAVMPRKPDRRRKLYNGRLETCYYQYYGKRPPRKESSGSE
ncbi:MAG: THUMP domain-containing class I SAM-dependent RNA methyltransferase [Anaerovoracaceae bacterium]|jgi:putative N6-adenine-specific DNA methylase